MALFYTFVTFLYFTTFLIFKMLEKRQIKMTFLFLCNKVDKRERLLILYRGTRIISISQVSSA